jgi:hypothetical protein
MATHVVEGPDHAVPPADDDHVLPEHVAQQERAGLRGLLGAPDGDPVAAEDLLELPLVDLRVVVGAGREERGPPEGRPDSGELLRG